MASGDGSKLETVTIGRALLSLGVLLAFLGVVLMVLEKSNFPLGRLPGDLLWKRGGTTIYAPLATCFLVSVALSFLWWLFGKR